MLPMAAQLQCQSMQLLAHPLFCAYYIATYQVVRQLYDHAWTVLRDLWLYLNATVSEVIAGK